MMSHGEHRFEDLSEVWRVLLDENTSRVLKECERRRKRTCGLVTGLLYANAQNTAGDRITQITRRTLDRNLQVW
ncbi:hypothetical protein CGQ25_13855 [Sinomonas sp. R1AF57]|nr:hypothetical protein CGQ25_13855 [Sinomonas sp. R1AF57]